MAFAPRLGALTLVIAVVGACAEPHFVQLRWPNDADNSPAQPRTEAAAIGLSLHADAVAYEPDAVVVELVMRNTGADALVVERGAILLAWDELEYAPKPADRDAPEPAKLELAAGDHGRFALRYQLGRALTGPGAYLIVRGAQRGEADIVDLPHLVLPAMPTN